MFSRWRVDQWIEVDRPAHGKGVRDQHTRCILVPERFAQALDGRPAKIVGDAEVCMWKWRERKCNHSVIGLLLFEGVAAHVILTCILDR